MSHRRCALVGSCRDGLLPKVTPKPMRMVRRPDRSKQEHTMTHFFDDIGAALLVFVLTISMAAVQIATLLGA